MDIQGPQKMSVRCTGYRSFPVVAKKDLLMWVQPQTSAGRELFLIFSNSYDRLSS